MKYLINLLEPLNRLLFNYLVKQKFILFCGGDTTINEPAPIDPGKAMGEYLFGKSFGSAQGVTDPRLQDRLLASEARYRPQYTALELEDINTLLGGRGDTKGLTELIGDVGREGAKLTRESLAEQRQADVEALKEFAPQVVQAYKEADPESAELQRMAMDRARRAEARATGPLSFDEQRGISQGVLSRFGTSDLMAKQSQLAIEEALGRRQFTQQLEDRASQAGQQAFGMSRNIAGDLGSTILGRPSYGMQFGQGLVGQAQQGASQPLGPNLFDANVGVNMAMQQRSQDMELMGAQAQASASRSSGLMGMAGSIGGALIGLCWVAREVYGTKDDRWTIFRDWVVQKSPQWFKMWYLENGEQFAEFIKGKKLIKGVLKFFMDIIIRKESK
ncbi:MAG: hypothetical protein ACXADH_17715 [Candidatus Kariarchaeaceae archaeon]|jgi:hypothetical protein